MKILWLYNILVLLLFFNIYVLVFSYKLTPKDCPCSRHIYLDIIKAYLIIVITHTLLYLYALYYNVTSFLNINKYLFYVLLPMNIGYTYITYKYIKYLLAKQCLCIKPVYLIIMYYVSLLTSVLFSLTGLLILISIIVYFIYIFLSNANFKFIF